MEMADDNSTRDTDGKLDPKTDQYIQELLSEKHEMESSNHPHAARLLQEEVSRVLESGRGRPVNRLVDVFHEKPTKVVTKVIVPIKEHPRFNFVGKLLGPKGNTLKRLQEETQCRMSVLGRGSMKDKNKEEQLRQGLDPKYSHLSDELHVEISALAAPAEAHARVAYALAEVRKYLIPDSNDDIAAIQARELERFDPEGDGYESEGDNGFMNNSSHQRPMRGGRGGLRGSFRGGNFGSSPPLRGNRGGLPLRGNRGRGGPAPAASTKPYDSFDRFDSHGSDQSHGYSTTSQTYGSMYEGAQRRPTPPVNQQFEDTTHGRWKRGGGGSRFMERSLPYTRRT